VAPARGARQNQAVSASPFAGKLWLAPLTRGGHLAFRRLCVEFGAEVTVSEMVVVRNLLRDRAAEYALLRSHPTEDCFGVQLADRKPETLAEGARIAEARGARFIDLNCGCPIDAITNRGMGASLLRQPRRLARLVAALGRAVALPVTVKLRIGWSESRANAPELARICEENGARAIVIHGRSREQRYSHAADWDLIGRVAAERSVPVVGNGDILTWHEARDRMARSGASSVMVARGALIKPWIFRELREGRTWLPTADERLGVLWRFLTHLRDYFGPPNDDDERGRRRVLRFLLWHLSFFCRYRPLPEAEYLERARVHPLLQTRWANPPDLDPLEALLRDPRPDVHERLACELAESRSEEEVQDRSRRLAAVVQPPADPLPGEADVAPGLVAG
jgi:tRNA-dihydrouridine synthase 3